MLSYRHAFHAGNHADVLKHLILTQIAEYMGEKPAPFWIIDTHAGAGRYALESAHASKLGEYKDGIGRLWDAKGLPPAVTDYVDLVRQLNPDGQLKHYPGSPWLARQLLREGDRLRVFEMHSTDIRLLQECFKGAGRAVTVSDGDGFAGLKAMLPPPTAPRPGADRPFLRNQERLHQRHQGAAGSAAALSDRHLRAVVPDAGQARIAPVAGRLRALGASNWLHATLEVKAPARDGFGMNGSGMFIINPPWTLEKLHETLPRLTELLAQGEGAKYTLESEST
jgi:23S rRNA (adenine2030-N6)-methyltransferase